MQEPIKYIAVSHAGSLYDTSSHKMYAVHPGGPDILLSYVRVAKVSPIDRSSNSTSNSSRSSSSTTTTTTNTSSCARCGYAFGFFRLLFLRARVLRHSCHQCPVISEVCNKTFGRMTHTSEAQPRCGAHHSTSSKPLQTLGAHADTNATPTHLRSTLRTRQLRHWEELSFHRRSHAAVL